MEGFQELETHIRMRGGFGQSDLEAAMLVAEGKLDARLFDCGVPASKVIAISDANQKRLLSGEKFPLMLPNGTTKREDWFKMTDAHRNQLIGRGGQILSPKTQKVKTGIRQEHIAVCEHARFDDGALEISTGTKKSKMDAGAIFSELLKRNELDDFRNMLDEFIAEQGNAVAVEPALV